jgi:hypothetical protein
MVVQGGAVTLQGIVPSHHDRQLIVAVARHVAGVRRVEDELTVVPTPPRRHEHDAEAESAGVGHGGTELASEAPRPDPFQLLPVLSPSLEEILAAQAQSA